MTIKCLVVDDEPVARKGIASYVEQIPFLTLAATCKGSLEANDFLRREPVDLLFIDIQMPGITGIDFIKSLSQPPEVIFTTAYRDYATEGFELNALDYLVKPISFQRFLKAANKALNHFETKQQLANQPVEAGSEFFFIKCDGQFIKIRLEDVLFFESERDYVFIHTEKKRYMTLLSLKQLEKELPAEKFLRVHRSYIIAADRVELLEGNQIKIKDRNIPISRSLHDTIYNKLVANRLWRRDM